MARLLRKGKQVSPTELNRPNVRGRGDAAPETLYVRADPTATTASRQPTTSRPYAIPLTTTFMPPESCNEQQLTMLSSPAYFIWLNEPVPVPGTTVSDCYPPEFMSYYSTYQVNPTTVGSSVPMMSPLVCPFGWKALSIVGNYQACCPVSAYVEVFGSASASGTILITASGSEFANYAHVIDGIVVSTLSPTSSGQTPAESAQSDDFGDTSLSPGAIAGIVVGVVAAVALLAVGIFVFARRHRQRLSQTLPPPAPPKDEIALTTVGSTIGTQSSPNHPDEIRLMQTGYSEMAAESLVHELDAGRPT
ncbi:hypothetical protein CHU98_g6658 [Xylaria longipes]|nr:hypothetical protein CHU98_g6658 [Xylaria longipes]